MEATIKKKKQTPLEKLQSDKLYCKQRSRELELRLNDNFSYIQKNAGGILFSSVSLLLFPGKKKEKADNILSIANTLPALATSKLGLSGYLSIGKSILPHVWAIVKPVLLTWGISKTQSILIHKLFGKKKGKK